MQSLCVPAVALPPVSVVLPRSRKLSAQVARVEFLSWKASPAELGWHSRQGDGIAVFRQCVRDKIGIKVHARKAERGPDSEGFSPVEVLDPADEGFVSGDESHVDINALNLLDKFVSAVGLDNEDMSEYFDEMRSFPGRRIVKQLVGGFEGFEEMMEELYGDDEQVQELMQQIQGLIQAGDQDSAREILEGNYEALMDQIEDEGVKGVEQAAMLDIIAFLYLVLGDGDSAQKLLKQAKDILLNIEDLNFTVCTLLDHIAAMFSRLDKPREALPLLVRSLYLRRQDPGEDVSGLLKTMLSLAGTYSDIGNAEKSRELHREIVAFAEDTLGPDDVDLAVPLLHLGSSLLQGSDIDEAEDVIERALELTRKGFGATDGRYGVATCVLAQARSYKGDFVEAINLYKKGLHILEGTEDFSQESVHSIYADLAALYTVSGRHPDAAKILRTLPMDEETVASYYTSQLLQHFETLSGLYAETGELDKAEDALNQCIQLLKDNLGPEAPEVSFPLQALASLLHIQPNRQSEAEPLAYEALKIREAAFGKYHPSVGEACSCLGSILHGQERDAEAVLYMKRVLDIQEKTLGYDSPEIIETLEVLAMLVMSLGRYSETTPILKRLEQLKAQTQRSLPSGN